MHRPLSSRPPPRPPLARPPAMAAAASLPLPDRPTLGPSLDALASGAAAPRAPLSPAAAAGVDFLQSLGTDDIVHTSAEPFSDHLVGLLDVMAWWGQPAYIQLGALFHSIYGTEGFQGFALPCDAASRARVASIIGADAERVAFIFCGLDRGSQDAGLLAGDRTTAPWRPRACVPGGAAAWHAAVAEAGAADPAFWSRFTALTLGDWLQQVEDAARVPSPFFGWGAGQAWGYRRRAFAAAAAALGGAPAAMHAAVYGREPEGAGRAYEWAGWGEAGPPPGV